MKLPRVGRSASLFLAGMAAITMIGGCDSSNATASGGTNEPGGSTGIQAYFACLTQHGVTLPSRAPGSRPPFSPGARPSRSPGAGGGFGGGGFGGGGFGGGGFGGGFGDPSNPPAGVDAATWSAALAACQSLRPTFTGRNPGNSAFTAYLNCLSDHGVTSSAGPGRFNTADPKVAAAMKICAPLRPTGRPSPAPTASG